MNQGNNQIIQVLNNRELTEDGIPNVNWKQATSIYDFYARDLAGNLVHLERYRGYICIIVNTASRCGLVEDNFKELKDLQEDFAKYKLRILAFPCNQFAGQEPGSNLDIFCFAQTRDAQFDFFEKINVNGSKTHPLWRFLKDRQGGFLGSFIKWNFTKFLIDQNGQPVARYGPRTNPSEIEPDIEKLVKNYN